MTIKTITGALILITALALASAALLNEASKAEANTDRTVVSIPKKPPQPKPAPRAPYAYTDEQKTWQAFLKNEMAREGFTERDQTILHTIILCESGWKQYRTDGSVVVANGNIGLGQINRLAHKKTYTAMNLDPNNPYDNLRFSLFLYRTRSIKPWDQWSGHCWRPLLAAQDIVP